MVHQRILRSSRRLAWLEGVRIFAAVLLLIYHAQLLFTGYAYTPQPTGLVENMQHLIAPVDGVPDRGLLFRLLGIPGWFGFQVVDVFVLISGFSLVVSLQDKPLDTGLFLKRRLLRILWPFWTVAWLSYPILWAIGTATDTYVPDAWHVFAGSTFPLIFDYSGELLLHTSGSWWFIPLMVSFTLLFPFLWNLLQRWGAKNLLWVSLMLTLTYRVLVVYRLGGHPNYVILDTPTDWEPFLLFLAKLSTFVMGMVVGHLYSQGKGPVFWSTRRAFSVGLPVYAIGFVCQFYELGWVVVDLLLPVGLTLCCMGIFRSLGRLLRWTQPVMLWLGAYSYTYFLLHHFVVDRTLRLVVQGDVDLYILFLPVMILGVLILAVIADYTRPLIQGVVVGLLQDLDYILSRMPERSRRAWSPRVGERVGYQGGNGWIVLKVEKLLDEREFFLCQVSDGQRSLWVNENDLEPEEDAARRGETSPNSALF
jgi:peptidoglycan/LPS O-acetylase OafA/YrhL